MFILRIGIFICLLTIVHVHSAISQEDHKEALDLISKFANEMCIAMPAEGKESNLILKGEGNAKLDGLLKQLAELGINGAVKFQTNEYKGVLQKDLISALKTTTDCRLEIFIKLQDKLIPTASRPNSNNSPDNTDSSHFFQYPLEVQNIRTGGAISNAQVIIDVSGKAPLYVLTDSNGFARVFISEKRSGEPGRLIVKADGYKKYVQNIDLSPIPLTHVIQLEPESNTSDFGDSSGSKNVPRPTETREGKLFVYTVPSNATVILGDGRQYYKGMSLPAGKYKIIVSAKGYEEKERWVTLKSGKTESFTVELEMVDISRPIPSS